MRSNYFLFLAQSALLLLSVCLLEHAVGGEDSVAHGDKESSIVVTDDCTLQEKKEKDKKDKDSDKSKKDKDKKDKKDKDSDKSKKDKDKKDKDSDKSKKDKDKKDKDSGKDYGSLKYLGIKYGSLEREALVAYPKSAGKVGKDKKDKEKSIPAPVIFVFHGHGQNMKAAADAFGCHKHWDDAICVYMQGIKTVRPSDPMGKYSGWDVDTNRDLLFFDAALAQVKKAHAVDDSRIFVTGFSNGAGFVFHLWAKRGAVLRAIAPCAGAYKGTALIPRPYLHVAGRGDTNVDFDKQKETIENVLKWNGCDGKGVDWPKSKSALDGKMYSSTKGAPSVKVIHDGSHEVPTGTGALVVRFFQEVTKK